MQPITIRLAVWSTCTYSVSYRNFNELRVKRREVHIGAFYFSRRVSIASCGMLYIEWAQVLRIGPSSSNLLRSAPKVHAILCLLRQKTHRGPKRCVYGLGSLSSGNHTGVVRSSTRITAYTCLPPTEGHPLLAFLCWAFFLYGVGSYPSEYLFMCSA